jgi:hypothetical protein
MFSDLKGTCSDQRARILWLSVIRRALKDLTPEEGTTKKHQRKVQRLKRDAERWLFEEDTGLEATCENAGVSLQRVREEVRKRLSEEKV